jgi:hypothetical protein
MTTPTRGHLRMRMSSPLTGAAVELLPGSFHSRPAQLAGHANQRYEVVTVRLLEPAAGYAAGTTLHVGADEFIAAPPT